jgi:predicted transcriptional regulator
MSADTAASRLMLRLPGDLHTRLHALADQHDRSLNGEIVAALRQYAEGVTELRYTWSEPPEEAARAWADLAGATLNDDAEEGWEYTPEEEAHLRSTTTRRGRRARGEARRAPR